MRGHLLCRVSDHRRAACRALVSARSAYAVSRRRATAVAAVPALLVFAVPVCHA